MKLEEGKKESSDKKKTENRSDFKALCVLKGLDLGLVALRENQDYPTSSASSFESIHLNKIIIHFCQPFLQRRMLNQKFPDGRSMFDFKYLKSLQIPVRHQEELLSLTDLLRQVCQLKTLKCNGM